MNKNMPLLWVCYIVSLLGVVSSNEWFMLWIFIEMNSLVFLPILLKSKGKKMAEASLLYFVVQGLSSIFLLWSMLNEESFMSNWMEPNSLFILSAVLKLGVAWFFNWVFFMSLMLNFFIFFLMLTLQKLAPYILMMTNQSSLSTFVLTLMIVSAIMGSSMNLKQSNFKIFMGFSSLSNTSWLLMGLMLSVVLWELYFFVYSVTILLLFFMNNKHINQNYVFKTPLENNVTFLSVGGMPPLPGFFPKMLILLSASFNNLFWIVLSLLLLSCADLFAYMRFSYTSSFLNKKISIFKSKSKKNLSKLMSLSGVMVILGGVFMM